jgi:hypothetical protein
MTRPVGRLLKLRRSADRHVVTPRGPSVPKLSMCAVTNAPPAHVVAFLEAWRPAVEEIVLAVDERADPDTLAAAASLADELLVAPAQPFMERYLGWLHAHCSGDWIMRADDDELPSEALIQALPSLLAEREPTHYWLPRRWIHASPGEFIAEGEWATDIQVRLIRALPGLWRFPGRLHTNVEVLGASRVVDAPLLHLVTVMHDVDARRAKAEGYERVTAGVTHELGRPINLMYIPEATQGLRHERLPPEDERRVEAFLARWTADVPVPSARPAVPEPPGVGDLEHWLDDRDVSDDAYRAEVRLVNGVAPMRAGALQHVQVDVTNLGDGWLPRGPAPEPEIVVGHRWFRPDGTEIDIPTPRTPLSETVAPGATTRLPVALRAPLEWGSLELAVDLVHEWVRWFDCPVTQTVEVGPPIGGAEGAGVEVAQSGSRDAAEAVLPRLLEVVPARSIVDFGCGTGTWLAVARALGVEDVRGLESEWVREQDLEIPPERFQTADLTIRLGMGRRYDLALSLEVAHRLSPGAAPVLVHNLIDAASIIAFSAAIPGQSAEEQQNEQWPSYWADLFAVHGYEPLDIVRPLIWNDPRAEWYAQNLVLFGTPRAFDSIPTLRDHPSRGARPLPLVHPRALAAR